MRPFTHNQFVKNNCEIPNLHPDFKMEIEEGFNSYGREVTLKRYYIKGSALSITSSMTIINEEWYHIFSISNQSFVVGLISVK